MHENEQKVRDSYPEGSFEKLFFEEQLKAATVGNPRQVHWHPVLVVSQFKIAFSSSYHALRSTGFIKLLSERTLFDYTHYFTNKVGFQDEVTSSF